MKKLVSIPPMANVTDQGATAQTMAAARPANGQRRHAASMISKAHVNESAMALTNTASCGKPESGPTQQPLEGCKRKSEQRGRRPQHRLAGVVYEAFAGKGVLRVAEGYVGVINGADARQQANHESQQGDPECGVGYDAAQHKKIIQMESTEHPQPLSPRSLGWIAVACALASGAYKAVLLLMQSFPFNADEAIVGLMARHSLQGAIPIFFYGQAYMGSLDALLVAGVFSLTGESVLGIRSVQVGLYMLTVASAVLLAGQIFPRRMVVIATGLLLAFPAVHITLYTTVSLGGYGEALLFGTWLMLVAWNLVAQAPSLVDVRSVGIFGRSRAVGLRAGDRVRRAGGCFIAGIPQGVPRA